jgi:hypothetical protein
MDDRQREARLQTLETELEAERRQRRAAEAEAVAARAASDELKLQIQRAGLEEPIRAQQLRRSGLLILLVLLVMALAAAATVGIVYYRKVERQLVTELGETRARLLLLGREADAVKRAATARQEELWRELERCRAKPCPVCPKDDAPATEEKADPKRAGAAQSAAPAPRAAASPLGVDVTALLVRAQHEYVSRRFASARDLTRQIIRVQPSHDGAIRLLGACACALKDRVGARWAFERLDSGARAFLTEHCHRQGIELP